jgi:hypothetical protein
MIKVFRIYKWGIQLIVHRSAITEKIRKGPSQIVAEFPNAISPDPMFSVYRRVVIFSWKSIRPHFEFFLQFIHGIPKTGICFNHIVYRLHGVDYRTMIPSSKMVTDGFE